MDLLDSNVSSIIVKRNVFGLTSKVKPTPNLTVFANPVQLKDAIVQAFNEAGMNDAADRLSTITDKEAVLSILALDPSGAATVPSTISVMMYKK